MSRQIACAFAVACAAFAVLTSPAAAATPCWKALLNDWYDGHIDHIYAIPCYHEAIKHLPTDVEVYSNARDDIQNALLQAIAKKNDHPIVTTNASGQVTTVAVPTTTPTATTPTKKKKKGGLGGAIRDITPGGADSFPLPLLILGMLAILLVLAGVGGIAWRRYQGRGGGGGSDSPTGIT